MTNLTTQNSIEIETKQRLRKIAAAVKEAKVILKQVSPPLGSTNPQVCPIDPAEREACDACQ